MSYENRCPICGEDRNRLIRVTGNRAKCFTCGCSYILSNEIVDEEHEYKILELMGAIV